MSGTFLALSGRLLWRLLESRGIEPAPIFREAGLDPALMEDSRARYPLGRVAVATAKAEDLIGDPCLGLDVAGIWRPTDQHALGYAFIASSTLRSALQRFVRYFSVVNDGLRFALDEDGERAIVSVEVLDGCPAPPKVAEDARWSMLTSMCRYIHGDALDPIEVCFVHPEPPCRGRFYGFFRCPVEFGAPESRLVFAVRDLDRPLPASNRELAHSNDRILAEYLAELQQDSLANRVRAALVDAMPNGNPSEDDIAEAVSTSSRTLQRRLAEEGTSFSKLLSSVRRELAEKYIVDQALSLGEVSYLLGFSEVSAFSRAFRRWTGESPTRYRDQAA